MKMMQHVDVCTEQEEEEAVRFLWAECKRSPSFLSGESRDWSHPIESSSGWVS